MQSLNIKGKNVKLLWENLGELSRNGEDRSEPGSPEAPKWQTYWTALGQRTLCGQRLIRQEPGDWDRNGRWCSRHRRELTHHKRALPSWHEEEKDKGKTQKKEMSGRGSVKAVHRKAHLCVQHIQEAVERLSNGEIQLKWYIVRFSLYSFHTGKKGELPINWWACGTWACWQKCELLQPFLESSLVTSKCLSQSSLNRPSSQLVPHLRLNPFKKWRQCLNVWGCYCKYFCSCRKNGNEAMLINRWVSELWYFHIVNCM